MTFDEAVNRIQKLETQIENLIAVKDRGVTKVVGKMIEAREQELLELNLLITEIETQ